MINNFNLTYNYSEEEQRKAYIAQLKSVDKKIKIEVPIFSRTVDLIILKKEKNKEKIIAIEFKLRDWKKVLEQALKLIVSIEYIVICVMEPKNYFTKSLIIEKCQKEKIGLIFSKYINNSYIFYDILKPLKQTKTWNIQKNKVLELLK